MLRRTCHSPRSLTSRSGNWARSFAIAALAGILFIAATPAAHAAESFEKLLSRAPADTNFVVLIDAETLMASPMAKANNWAGKEKQSFKNRPMLVNANVRRVARAAHINLETLSPLTEVAILNLVKSPTDLKAVAKKFDGYVDKIRDTEVVWSSRGVYLVPIDTQTAAAIFPGNRQVLLSWMKNSKNRLSENLSGLAALTKASDAPQIIAAADLEDVVPLPEVTEWIRNEEWFRESSLDQSSVAAQLASVKQVRLEVTIVTEASAKLVATFNEDVTSLKSVAKKILVSAVRERGLEIEGLDGWIGNAVGKEMSIEGPLTASALLRVGSLLEAPNISLDNSGRDDDTADAGNPALYASQRYFQSIDTLLSELWDKKKDSKGMGCTAQYFETFAQKMDRLPILNVDEELLTYGKQVSDILRQMSQQIRTANVRGGVRQAQNAGYRSYGVYGYNGYNGAYGTTVVGRMPGNDQAQINVETRAEGGMAYVEGRPKIDELTTSIRRAMTEKYKAEF